MSGYNSPYKEVGLISDLTTRHKPRPIPKRIFPTDSKNRDTPPPTFYIK